MDQQDKCQVIKDTACRHFSEQKTKEIYISLYRSFKKRTSFPGKYDEEAGPIRTMTEEKKEVKRDSRDEKICSVLDTAENIYD